MNTLTTTIVLTAAATCAAASFAEPIEGIYTDLPGCDDHGFLQAVEEFGDPSVFASDEAIDHAATFTDLSACTMTDNPDEPNALVVMTNLTGRFLSDLFYVGDPETRLSNVDGVGEGGGSPGISGLAFRIDSIGANRPLVFESLTPDGIFEPGETWQFIVQDYGNLLGLAPDSFFSIGMAGDSTAIVQSSAASIVRMVPAPGTLALLGGSLAFARRRRTGGE